ncbi:MAG: ribonuclease III [Dysgonamonadaceae bacterium]|nr:ribonuclease III [Dysgonamonadaceae bacterium]
MIGDFFKAARLFLNPKKGSYFVLYKILGFLPKNLSYYEEALLHKSSLPLNKKSKSDKKAEEDSSNNERLEFLGDAIINAVVGDIVFRKFKDKDEGFLTNTRSKIVKRESLDIISHDLGLDRLILTSDHIKLQKTHVYGNALEAFIGAIYLDKGYDKTYNFIEQKIIKSFINIDKLSEKEVNFKSKLLEWSQKFKVVIEFVLLENFTDEDRNPIFQSQVLLNGLSGGIGTGFCKKESQQQAAQMALKKIKADASFAKEVMEKKMNNEKSDMVDVAINAE